MAVIVIIVTFIGVLLGLLLDHFQILAWWTLACLSPIIGCFLAILRVKTHRDYYRSPKDSTVKKD